MLDFDFAVDELRVVGADPTQRGPSIDLDGKVVENPTGVPTVVIPDGRLPLVYTVPAGGTDAANFDL